MDKKIIAYGYGDKTESGFATVEDLIEYLRKGIFTENDCRHRYTQSKKADIIVVSQDGFAYGHMIIKDIIDPNSDDRDVYPKVKKVYIIESTAVYEHSVKLKELGIRVTTFGTPLTLEQFEKIKNQAREIQEYFPPSRYIGFGEIEKNKKVETAAITYVSKWYRKRGWTVRSVEDEKCGYDLICQKQDEEEHVEVKGVS